MNYYEVWVRSNHYRGSEPLTYSYVSDIGIGKLVSVPLRNETVTAVVTAKTTKPKVKTKEIINVSSLPPLPRGSLELMRWLKAYYPSPIGVIAQQFIPSGIVSLSPIDSDHSYSTTKLPSLTSEQTLAIDSMNANDTYLLHGRTGSGKTRIYQELALETVKNGRSVLVLTPEISLTTQLETNFKALFGEAAVLMHSTLTPKQRRERWAKIISSKRPLVVIGPRSVIFSPVRDIGLIVIDEEHEPAYKQEQAPYYVTARVAAKLRDIHGAKLILGSATPLVSDYYLAQSRNKPIIRLTSLAKQTPTHLTTEIIDSHDRSLFPRSNYISQPLILAIEEAMSRGEQSLLYLNRRGTARAIVCTSCDYQAHCPRCDLPLTYHGDEHILRCHVCGYYTSAPITCPKCSNPTIKYLSIGTKAVVSEVEKLFPDAKIQRFDSDSAKAERLEQHFEEIKRGEVDIIVGTQLLAKGLDLPKLAVVGILLADTSLQLPDYTVNERTFQLLSQVIGRVGRGHIDGKAIIQTYQPKALAINAAIEDGWDEFYSSEIKERELYSFPPFSHMLKITIARASSKNAEKAAEDLVGKLPKTVKIEGPAPAFHEKQAGRFRWQVIVKSSQRSKLLEIISNLPSNCSWDIDPSDLI